MLKLKMVLKLNGSLERNVTIEIYKKKVHI